MTGFLVFSGVAVSLSYYFSPHYFVMLLPAVCLLTAHAFSAASHWCRTRKPGTAWATLPLGIFALMSALVVIYHHAIFFNFSPEQACRGGSIYGSNPFIECQQIGRYIREHSRADARIAILGSEPELLFYAHRHSATGYIYTYDFFEPQPYAGEMQREMISEIENARPEYLYKCPYSNFLGFLGPTFNASQAVPC